jgi:hypothetical protein
MKARLATARVAPERGAATFDTPPLAALTARDPSDATIALLDAWATVGDVLTFYQERIANEGYLRTATERRSVVELGRLVGYAPRPGVAASIYLAFTLENGYESEIPEGTRVQSVPAPGELPQVFETSDPIRARWSWNKLKPRASRPQRFDGGDPKVLRFEGITTNLRVNDVLVFDDGDPRAVVVRTVDVDAHAGRTTVSLAPYLREEKMPPNSGEPGDGAPESGEVVVVDATGGNEAPPGGFEQPGAPDKDDEDSGGPFERALRRLIRPFDPSTVPPRHATTLRRSLRGSFGPNSDFSARIMTELLPELRGTLYKALSALPAKVKENDFRVYAMRVSTPAFGYNAPPRYTPASGDAAASTDEWPPSADERPDEVFLDGVHDGIVADSYAVLVRANKLPLLVSVLQATSRPRTDYSLSAKTTHLKLSERWWVPTRMYIVTAEDKKELETDIRQLRALLIHAQAEPLKLAEEPIEDLVEKDRIMLDGLYDGIEAGRWMVVTGEREDVKGLYASELVMIAAVVQEPFEDAQGPIPGDTLHTTLLLGNKLANAYVRSTVTIHGNVARATHGETRHEVLGSGDASKALQAFTLRQSPLTYTSAANAAGVESTLQARVNGVVWPEAPSLMFLGPLDRELVTKTNEDGKTTVITGNGEHGARLPSGVENVTAVYRTGIGQPGNVAAGQVTLLMTAPLGVRQVVNPMPAAGGADRETRDQARENVPLAVMALDRIVSVRDYADFARTFAGIGKAEAIRAPLPGGRGQLGVTVVIAGAGDAPITETSDVYRNLLEAFHRLGAPNEPMELVLRTPVILILSAGVHLVEGYEWKRVEPVIRAAVLQAFGFDRRRLGEPASQSALVRVIHGVPGVEYVDVDAFGGITAPLVHGRPQLTPDEIEKRVKKIVEESAEKGPASMVPAKHPYELAYFTPAAPNTLILTELRP